MARPRKAPDFDEELMRIDSQIARWQNTIKELEAERRELLKQKEQAEMSKIYEVFKASGLSASEFLAAVEHDQIHQAQ